MTNIAPTPPVEDLAVLAGGFTATNGSGLFNFGPADGTNHGAGPTTAFLGCNRVVSSCGGLWSDAKLC